MRSPVSDEEPEAEVDRLTFLTGADLSWDADRVAYTTVTATDGDDIASLWLATSTDAPAQQIDVDGAPSAPRWSPDGRHLAFTAVVDEVPQLYLADLSGDTVQRLTSFPHGVIGAASWSPDGALIAVSVVRSRRTDRTLPYAVDRTPWLIDGMGEVTDALSDICTVDVESGFTTRLTDHPTVDLDPRWSDDGRSILFVRTHEPDDLRPVDRHVVVDLAGNETAVAWPGGMYAAGTLAPDGRVVSTAYRQGDRRRGTAPDLFVTDLAGMSDNRTEGMDLHVGASVLAHTPGRIMDPGRFIGVVDGRAILAQLVGGEQRLVAVALDGERKVRSLLDGPAAHAAVAIRGSTVLHATSSMNQPPDLFLLDLADGESTRITDVNAERTPVPLDVRSLDVTSDDGTVVEAWFLAPPEATTPLPTVLLIHGGPYAAYGHVFDLDAQRLARAGYGVLMANPRGSLGYGSAFGTATQGAWGTRDYEDLMAVVDTAIDRGLADPDRLGVHGLSYGGYMTAWIVTHTDRFRAAVSENPVIDLRSFRGTSDIGITFTDDIMDGTLVEVPERYIECSPLTYAPHCTTPTRLIVSESDHRCPPSQAEQFHSALREHHCPTDMIRLPGASHAGSVFGEPAVRRAKAIALLEWMDRYVRGGP